MHIENIDIVQDTRSDCYSIMIKTSVGDYLSLIKEIYERKGGIEFQREPLKTTSAIRIRSRMVSDINAGAVLPPIVLGVIMEEQNYSKLNPSISVHDFSEMLSNTTAENIAIIDGMQRTTAFKEAELSTIKSNPLRIEFWVARNTNSLIYRMLVLNTGQVPWNLRRQLEVVFTSLIEEVGQKVNEIKIIKIDGKERRKVSGEFQANDIVDLYLAFGARKEIIETKDRLADEFVRLDFIEATENLQVINFFYECLNFLGRIDKEFGRFKGKEQKDDSTKFVGGVDLFTSHPARVGFITSLAKKILGRPGNDKDDKEQMEIWTTLNNDLENFVSLLAGLNEEQMETFLSFAFLNESIDRKSSKVGQFEREYFTKAFEALVEERFRVHDLQVCWRAY